MTFRIVLPWPAPELNPNSRCGWRRKAEAVQTARNVAFVLTMDTLQPFWGDELKLDGDLQLTLVLHPPNKRRFDQDNIVAANKAQQDSVCQALGIDDHAIKRTIIEWGAVIKGGEILLELLPIEDNLNGGKDETN